MKDNEIREVTYKEVKDKKFTVIMDFILILFLLAFCIGSILLVNFIRNTGEISNIVFDIIVILFGIIFAIFVQSIVKCKKDFSECKKLDFMYHAQKMSENDNEDNNGDSLE